MPLLKKCEISHTVNDMKKTILSLLVAVGLIASASAQLVTDTFNYTGNYQSFSVPVGVASISFDLLGASGGNASGGGWSVGGGNGAEVTGTLSVNSGEILYFNIGGIGSDSQQGASGGYNGGGVGQGSSGGGGGGATDIRVGGVDLTNRVAVAGGGGGANSVGGYGGGPGGLDNSGQNGGGVWWHFSGDLGTGNNGAGGGGGGGYYGGSGGGYGYSQTSGSGGSSYVDPNQVTGAVLTDALHSSFRGNGSAVISFIAVPEPSTYVLFGIGALALIVACRRKVA